LGFEEIFVFLEAIFTGIYLYGWPRLQGWAHFWTGIPIALTGIGGAVAVMAANSWMNQPGGMIVAAHMVVGFLVASVYAAGILRGIATTDSVSGSRSRSAPF